jgi:CDP-paratose 2-epimerase
VRDILFVDDLLDAYEAVINNIGITAGQIYNVGGGQANTISVWYEFSPILEELLGRSISVTYGDWRVGDQPVYISDIRKMEYDLRWCPTISVREGITRLFEWIRDHQEQF